MKGSDRAHWMSLMGSDEDHIVVLINNVMYYFPRPKLNIYTESLLLTVNLYLLPCLARSWTTGSPTQPYITSSRSGMLASIPTREIIKDVTHNGSLQTKLL